MLFFFLPAHFTIVQDKDGYILFHNNFNYLAIREGIVQLYAAVSIFEIFNVIICLFKNIPLKLEKIEATFFFS